MRPRLTLGLLAATAVTLAGCASAPDGAQEAEAFECPLGTEGCDVNEPVGDGGEMTIIGSRESEFSFTIEDGLSVTGDIDVTFTNEGAGVHNVVAIGGADGSELIEAQPGETDTGVFRLFPGEWTVICDISGHRGQGMEATVQVFPTQDELDDALAEGVDPEEGETEAGGEGGTGADGEELVLEPDTEG